jgi:hypothetical protein
MDEPWCFSFGFGRRNNEAGSPPAPGVPTYSPSSIDYMLHIYYIILNFDYSNHSASIIIMPLTYICTVKTEITASFEELVTA